MNATRTQGLATVLETQLSCNWRNANIYWVTAFVSIEPFERKREIQCNGEMLEKQCNRFRKVVAARSWRAANFQIQRQTPAKRTGTSNLKCFITMSTRDSFFRSLIYILSSISTKDSSKCFDILERKIYQQWFLSVLNNLPV